MILRYILYTEEYRYKVKEREEEKEGEREIKIKIITKLYIEQK